MADFDVGDLWWLKPGGGQDNTIGQQFLQGMQTGANIRHQRVLEDFQQKVQAAHDMATTSRSQGAAEMSTLLSTISATDGWGEPANRAKAWAIGAAHPEMFSDRMMDDLMGNFTRYDQRMEKAREFDLQDQLRRQKQEELGLYRDELLKDKAERTQIYRQRADDYKASTDARIKQMAQSLPPGRASIFNARFSVIRDHYQFRHDQESIDAYSKETQDLVNEFWPQGLGTTTGAPPALPPPPAATSPVSPLSPVRPGRVRLQGPDGRIGTVPEDQVEDALRQGFKRVQ